MGREVIYLRALLLGSWLLLAPSGSDAQTPAHDEPATPARDVAAEARARFQRGVELYRAGDLRGTLAEFERANELRKSPLLSLYIGRVALELRLFARSYRAFEQFLAAPLDASSAEQREEAETRLRELRSRVAFVSIVTNVAGARLSVDDVPRGEAPLGSPLLLDVGMHRIRASREGYAAVAKVVTVGGGDSVTVSLELEPHEPLRRVEMVEPVRPLAADQPRDEARSVMTPLSWAGFSSAFAMVVAGGITGGLAIKTSRDLDDRRFVGDQGRDEFERESDRVHRLSLTSDLLFVAAAVTAGTTLGVVLVRARRRSNTAAAATRMLAAPTPTGLVIRGAF